LLILNCPQPDWFPIEASLFPKLPRPNDGLVSVSGVESQSYFHSLGHSSDCHSNLLSDKEYEMAKPILSRGWCNFFYSILLLFNKCDDN
jgi:hypothetical protein